MSEKLTTEQIFGALQDELSPGGYFAQHGCPAADAGEVLDNLERAFRQQFEKFAMMNDTGPDEAMNNLRHFQLLTAAYIGAKHTALHGSYEGVPLDFAVRRVDGLPNI